MAPIGPMPGRTPTRVPRSTPARASRRNVGSAKEAKPPPRSLSTAVPSLHEPEAARGQGNEQPVDEDEPRGCAKCRAQQHRLQHTGHSHDLGYRDNGARESDDETCGVGQQRDCESGEQDTDDARPDRKSTRLNSSHVANSYAVFCLKKKTKKDRES